MQTVAAAVYVYFLLVFTIVLFMLCVLFFSLLPDIAKVRSHGNEDHAPPKNEFNSCKRHY